MSMRFNNAIVGKIPDVLKKGLGIKSYQIRYIFIVSKVILVVHQLQNVFDVS
jgi:hypothetical protein